MGLTLYSLFGRYALETMSFTVYTHSGAVRCNVQWYMYQAFQDGRSVDVPSPKKAGSCDRGADIGTDSVGYRVQATWYMVHGTGYSVYADRQTKSTVIPTRRGLIH